MGKYTDRYSSKSIIKELLAPDQAQVVLTTHQILIIDKGSRGIPCPVRLMLCGKLVRGTTLPQKKIVPLYIRRKFEKITQDLKKF